MTIENKYGIPRETVQRMVNDGVIPCSVKNRYEIYDLFQQLKSQCTACTVVSIMHEVAEKRNESFENVRKIIYSWK
jgi:hypothetical protein